MGFETTAIRGVTSHYGGRKVDMAFGGSVLGERGIVKEAVWIFDYNNLPTPGLNKMQVQIPPYAKIVSAKLEILTGFTSTSTTTDLLIGLQQADATEIDNDGLLTAANATQTTIATRGNLVVGSGALVGVSIGAAGGELKVAPNVDDLLTGKGRVIVEYIVEGV